MTRRFGTCAFFWLAIPGILQAIAKKVTTSWSGSTGQAGSMRRSGRSISSTAGSAISAREERRQVGRLRRKPGGQWFVDYAEGEEDDEAGFRFGDERFVAGEYVSIANAGQMRTYQIARVVAP